MGIKIHGIKIISQESLTKEDRNSADEMIEVTEGMEAMLDAWGKTHKVEYILLGFKQAGQEEEHRETSCVITNTIGPQELVDRLAMIIEAMAIYKGGVQPDIDMAMDIPKAH